MINIIDINKFNEFKHILSGCDNKKDAKFMADLYKIENIGSDKIVTSLLEGKKYNNNKDFESIVKILEKCVSCVYFEDVVNVINDNFTKYDNEDNNLQYKSCYRIAKSKQSYKNTETKKKNDRVVKLCPHCSRPYLGNTNTVYAICGYSDTRNGYDWQGCQKDWCFLCEKKLCKSWDENRLNIEPNRIHNCECCKLHSNKHGLSYIDEYCHCTHKYVNRKNIRYT